jgi:hypothetical protein
MSHGGIPAVRAQLVTAAGKRFPLCHLAGRSPTTLPERDRIMADADRILAGEWDLFGRPAKAFSRSLDWRSHPLTGVPTAEGHWHRVPYIGTGDGNDVKYLWELNRHGDLVRLAQAYFLSGRAEYSEALADLLDRWMEQNPPGEGINWVSSLEVGLRAIGWCWMWYLSHRAPLWTDDRLGHFLWQLWHHGDHVARFDSVHHSPNTHLTGEALSLLYMSHIMPEFHRAARWHQLGCATLQAEVVSQLLPDGFHFERSTCYHRYTTEFYLHAALLLADEPAQLSDVTEVLDRLVAVIAARCLATMMGVALSALLPRLQPTNVRCWPVPPPGGTSSIGSRRPVSVTVLKPGGCWTIVRGSGLLCMKRRHWWGARLRCNMQSSPLLDIIWRAMAGDLPPGLV